MSTAFVVKPGFDMGALREHGVENIIFLTDGFSTDLSAIQASMGEKLKSFNPAKDFVVPVGSSLHNLTLGFMLSSLFTSVRILVFHDQRYEILHLDEDPGNTYKEVPNL